MPFVKGQTGNPGGRPKDKPFADALRMELAAAGEDHKALRRIASRLIAKAGEGDIQAIKEVADRMDGKVPQAVIGGGEDDAPIKQIVEWIIVDSPNRSAEAAPATDSPGEV